VISSRIGRISSQTIKAETAKHAGPMAAAGELSRNSAGIRQKAPPATAETTLPGRQNVGLIAIISYSASVRGGAGRGE
jgi:hypothetical protein